MVDSVEIYNQGVDHMKRNEYELAIEAFTQALELDPELAHAHNARAAARTLRGDVDEGLADSHEAIRLDPKEPKFYHTRGLVYREIGDKAKAEDDFAKAEALGLTF